MASEVKTNKISPATATTLSVGDSGDTLALATDAVTGFQVGSDAQGDVLYHDGTDYTRLGAGTSGYFLKTQGTSANPVWAEAGGTNTPSFGAYLAANQSLAVDTWTKITFNTEAWDSETPSAFDHATNYRFTVPDGESGKYFFSVSTTIDDVGGGDSLRSAYLSLYKNGVAFQSVLGKNAARQSIMYASFATVIELSDNGVSANDYVEFFAYINWDDNDGCCSGGQNYTFCSGFKLL